MKSLKIGGTVYSNGQNGFSFESATVVGVDVVNDKGEVLTWVRLDGGDEQRSITADIFFKNYTDVFPFFKVGFTYKNKNAKSVRYEITEILKSDKPALGDDLFAQAKRHAPDGTYSYVTLDRFSFSHMVQV